VTGRLALENGHMSSQPGISEFACENTWDEGVLKVLGKGFWFLKLIWYLFSDFELTRFEFDGNFFFEKSPG